MFRRQIHDGDWAKARVEALSDGVFAIAMTILVFNLKLPENLTRESTATDVWQGMEKLIPQFTTYIISFLILGAMWMTHHDLFQVLKRVDRQLISLNIIYLAFISLVPFSTSVFGSHLETLPGMIVYWTNTLMASGTLGWIWRTARRNPGILDGELTTDRQRVISERLLLMPVISVAAIGLAMIKPLYGVSLIWIVPLGYRVIQRFAKRKPKEA